MKTQTVRGQKSAVRGSSLGLVRRRAARVRRLLQETAAARSTLYPARHA